MSLTLLGVGKAGGVVGTPLTTGLVAYYKLDEAAGADATDSHSGNITLTKAGNPGTAAGKRGTSRSFDGLNDYFSVADGTPFDIDGETDFLISAWVYLDNNASERAILYRVADDFSTPAVALMLHDDGALSFRFSFIVGKEDSSTAEARAEAFGAPSTGTWYHLLAWRDVAGGVIGLRINDASEYTAAFAGNAIASTQELALGVVSFGGNNLAGRLDEVGIWGGQTKTATAATALYGGGTPPAYPFTGLTF